jgi:hypothetical protein
MRNQIQPFWRIHYPACKIKACPDQSKRKTNTDIYSYHILLDERSEDILEKLLAAGVGQRPVIFVGHSMGGLIIKKMLVAAQNSGNEAAETIAKNTKGNKKKIVRYFGQQMKTGNTCILYPLALFLMFPGENVFLRCSGTMIPLPVFSAQIRFSCGLRFFKKLVQSSKSLKERIVHIKINLLVLVISKNVYFFLNVAPVPVVLYGQIDMNWHGQIG